MKAIHTILREDFGLLDRNDIKADLIRMTGICGVYCEPTRNGLVIEYDPTVLDVAKLADIMCRIGVVPVDSRAPDIGLRIGDG